MKKLPLLALIAIAITSSAQDISGINEEHLWKYSTAPIPKTSGPKISRIALPTGVELEYAEQGNGEGIPVILLHGITDSWHSFESTMRHLPFSLHVFALSQRGHGNSTRPTAGYTSRDFATDVAAFIKAKGLGSAVIIGHSMGGVNAQQFAIDYPQLVRALVIIDSDASFKNNPGMPEFLQEVMNLKDPMDRNFMEAFQTASLGNPIDSAYFELLVSEGMKCPVKVFQSALKALIELDLTPKLKTIEAPTLILWGEKDGFCLRQGQELMDQLIPNSKLLIYANTGHSLHWEHPERFAKDLVNFIMATVK